MVVMVGSLGNIWEKWGRSMKMKRGGPFLPSVSLLCLSWLSFSLIFLHGAEKMLINSLVSIILRILNPQAKKKQ